VGTSKPSVVDIKVSQSAGSKVSLADVGLMVPSHERGFQKSSRALALPACSSNPFHLQKKLTSRSTWPQFCKWRECVKKGSGVGEAPFSTSFFAHRAKRPSARVFSIHTMVDPT
jgi:hypothetical protein